MFTGIVKSVSVIGFVTDCKGDLKIQIKKPDSSTFSALKIGDSVSVDGVCLTIEKQLPKMFCFHLGYETLKLTKWNKKYLLHREVNLEPALTVSDFVGGHFISGHVDGLAKVINYIPKGESVLMDIQVPDKFKHYFWEKSFITLNGVSLTVNSIKNNCLTVCLIPETLKQSNLSFHKPDNFLTFEVDFFARAIVSTVKASYKNYSQKL